MKTFFSHTFYLLGGLMLLSIFTTAKSSAIPNIFILSILFFWIAGVLGKKRIGVELREKKIDDTLGKKTPEGFEAYMKRTGGVIKKKKEDKNEEKLFESKIAKLDNSITIKNNTPTKFKSPKSNHYVKKSFYIHDSDDIGDHTYNKWDELGYQVKRGETSAYVHYGQHIFTRSQVVRMGSSSEDDYNRSYENHCWNCREHISSDFEEYCDDCEMFICSNCGECMCRYH